MCCCNLYPLEVGHHLLPVQLRVAHAFGQVHAGPETPELRAVVADSADAGLTDLFAVELPKAGGLPGFFNTGLRWMGKVMYGINLKKAAPIDVVSEIEPPVLFIRCESDTTIPSEHSPGHWRASGQTPEMLWLVNGPGGRSHL